MNRADLLITYKRKVELYFTGKLARKKHWDRDEILRTHQECSIQSTEEILRQLESDYACLQSGTTARSQIQTGR